MKVVASNAAIALRQAAAKTPASEYALWTGLPAAAPDSAKAPAPNLTPRQLDVLALLCEGLPNKLICQRLNIAPGTVKVHISCILRELGVASRLQAVVAARNLSLVGDPVAAARKQPSVAPVSTRPASVTRYREEPALRTIAVRF
jgi:DNA-binding NarL/FixJ family response regulator